MNTRLSNLACSIRAIPLNDKLSDNALIALSRSYISMQNLVVANHLDSEYGDHRVFEKALDMLYRICIGRCQADQPFARRCRLTPLLYMIVHAQMRGIDMKKSKECRDLMWRLVDEWMQEPDTHGERTSVYGVLRCIANLYCYEPEENRRDEEEFLWFKQRVSDWAALMNDEGRWEGISSGEALCRIEVMGRNSNMFLDPSHDEMIEKARTSYCKSILETIRRPDGLPLRNWGPTLFMLYEIMMWGAGVPDLERADEIAESARQQAGRQACGSDEWLLCQSTCLDRLCMQAGERIQEQMLADMACPAHE